MEEETKKVQADKDPAESVQAEAAQTETVQPDTGEDLHYIAFISYRHRPLDTKTAKRIQRSIENYTVPKGLRKEPGRKKLGRVFRDEDELPVSSSLSGSITYALDHTEYLIVICTPDLPLSRWCEQEIRYFIQTHDRDHVIGVLADGTPETSFSPLMLNTFDEAGNFLEPVEPLAANMAGKNHNLDEKMYRKEIYRIYAALLGCRFDDLWQRAKRARARRASMILGGAAALMAAFSVFLISKNATIRKQNTKISRQNDELTANMSSVQTDLGRSLLSEHFLTRAKQSGVRAIEDAGTLYDRRAETLLADAVSAYSHDKVANDVIAENGENIVDLELAKGGTLAVMLDHAGEVFCVSLDSSEELWRRAVPEPEADTGMKMTDLRSFKVYSELFPAAGGDLIVYKDYAKLIAFSAESGAEKWRFDYACSESWLGAQTNLPYNSFRVISDDGSLIALLDRKEEDGEKVRLIVLDAATGAERGSIRLDHVPGGSSYTWYLQGGSFTADNSALAVALDAEDGYNYFAVDVGSMTLLDTYSDHEAKHGIVYGLSYDRGNGNLFTAQLQSRKGGIETTIFHRDGSKETELTYHTISSDIGKYQDAFVYDSFIQPMLTRNGCGIICSDEIVLIFDLKTNTLINSCDISGRILDSAWAEDSNSVLYLLSSVGSTVAYRISPSGSISGASYRSSDLSSLALGRLIRSGFQNPDQPMKFVSVPTDSDSRLLAASVVSDPSVQFVDAGISGDDAYLETALLMLSPSKNRIFAFVYASGGGYYVGCLDASSLERLSSVRIESEYGADPPYPLDDEHFLYAGTIYSMDGSSAPISSAPGFQTEDMLLTSLTLSDGRVLTYDRGKDSSFAEPLMPPCCWIDGELAFNPKISRSSVRLEPRSPICAGANGLLLCWGGSVSEAGFDRQEKAFIVFDTGSGETSYIPDRTHTSEVQPLMAVGTEKPVFACAFEGNVLALCDTAKGELHEIAGDFQDGDILQLCFSAGDEYLLALTRRGVLYCIDTASEKAVWSGKVLDNTNHLERLTGTECTVLEDGRLCFSAVKESKRTIAVIDPAHDVVVSKIADANAVFPELHRLFSCDERQICSYALHTAEDLLAIVKGDAGE